MKEGLNKLDLLLQIMYTGLYSNILNGIYIMTIEKPKRSKRLGISLTGVTVEFKSEYEQLAKNNNMTHTEFARALLESYKHFNVELTEEDTATINQALVVAPITYKKKIKNVILRCAVSVVNSNSTDSTIDESKINSSRAADKRADSLLDLMFKHNEKTTNKHDKIFISKSSFLEFINKTKENGKIEVTTSKVVIARCLERRSALIEAHHAEQELDDSHNLKAHYARLKTVNSTNKTEV